MLSMVNHDKIPFGDIIYHAILGKFIGYGTRHKGTLVFPCLLHLLCEKSQVPSTASDFWQPPLVPYGKASIAMSQKVSKTFLTTVSSVPSSSEFDELRKQLTAKE
ncbi:unnamed protein product [Prunus brigantina]